MRKVKTAVRHLQGCENIFSHYLFIGLQRCRFNDIPQHGISAVRIAVFGSRRKIQLFIGKQSHDLFAVGGFGHFVHHKKTVIGVIVNARSMS